VLLHHPKSKTKQNKIKSETLDKRKEKLLVFKAFHNSLYLDQTNCHGDISRLKTMIVSSN